MTTQGILARLWAIRGLELETPSPSEDEGGRTTDVAEANFAFVLGRTRAMLDRLIEDLKEDVAMIELARREGR